MKQSDIPLPARRLAELMKGPPKWSQVRLGKAIGCSGQQIGKLLNSERTLDYHWAKRLAKALNCDPGDFFIEVEPSRNRDTLVLDLPENINESETETTYHYGSSVKEALMDGDESRLLTVFRRMDTPRKAVLLTLADDLLAASEAGTAKGFINRRA